MNTVGQLLKTKGTDVWSVSPQATVYDALQIMSEKDVGALVVLSQGKLTGIFSERDYARKLILMGKSSKETAVSDLMTREVLCIESQKTVQDCMALMTAKRVRHLPVLENEKLVGIVTIGDVVKEIIADHESTIEQLGKYITGA